MSFVSLKSIAISVSLAVSTAIGISAAPAFANTDFATGVVEYNQGKGVSKSRSIEEKALGSYDKSFVGTKESETSLKNFFIGNKTEENNKNYDFLSLGFDGSAIFEFGTLFLPEITVWETTHGDKGRNQNRYDEQVEVFVGNELGEGAEWISLGIIENIADGAYDNSDGATIAADENSEAFGQLFQYVKLVDKSEVKNGRDGFDVNAIAVKSVPEPASILGLLTVGVVSAGSLGKRKKK